MNINDLVHHLTVPCADNGYQFTRTERIDQINSFLVHSAYSLAASSPLSFLWKHRDFNPEKPVILVSSHIDSLYNLYHCIQQDDVFKGTFDNSITNAVIIHLMLENALPPQVLVAFTGDEEDSSRGADYIMSDLEALSPRGLLPEIVVVLDVTEEGYHQHVFSVENLFVRHSEAGTKALHFSRKKELANLIHSIFAPQPVHLIKNGDPDESWQYDEHDLNCFAFCLPIKTVTDDMHDDDGVYAKLSTVLEYTNSLQHLLHELDQQIN